MSYSRLPRAEAFEWPVIMIKIIPNKLIGLFQKYLDVLQRVNSFRPWFESGRFVCVNIY